VLKFLRDAATGDDAAPPAGVVVTVPASFQADQRQDTIQAARLAGIDLTPGQLLDEPIAPFIDCLVGKGAALVESLAKPKTLLVFDFGGGTCDVAIFRLQFSGKKPTLKAATLAVSRYHRLGGGDIGRQRPAAGGAGGARRAVRTDRLPHRRFPLSRRAGDHAVSVSG
jgi:molecular chaperone DnaK (HSP70)